MVSYFGMENCRHWSLSAHRVAGSSSGAVGYFRGWARRHGFLSPVSTQTWETLSDMSPSQLSSHMELGAVAPAGRSDGSGARVPASTVERGTKPRAGKGNLRTQADPGLKCKHGKWAWVSPTPLRSVHARFLYLSGLKDWFPRSYTGC